LDQKIIGENDLNNLVSELKRHTDDPQTLVIVGFFFQVWGRRPM
jgi:hypothetical protein